MSRYEGLREKADYLASMLTPCLAERKCFEQPKKIIPANKT